jgi:hypothetical protein
MCPVIRGAPQRAGSSRRGPWARTVSIPPSAIESQRLTVRRLLAVIAWIGLFATASPLLGQAPERRVERAKQVLSDQPRPYGHRDINDQAWFGVWQLNLDKSVYSPGPTPYKRATMKVERVDDKVRFSYDFVHLRGGIQHLEWTGRFDGNDYMVQGIDEYMTYAYKQMAERTYEIVAKADGQIAAVATVTLSPDGRTLTTVTRRKSARGQDITNTTVHDKIR